MSTPITGSYEHITLHDKKEFADVIKIDYLRLSEWPQSNHSFHYASRERRQKEKAD